MKLSSALFLVSVGVASAAAVDTHSEPYTAAGNGLAEFLEFTKAHHHDTALNARSDLNPAELTARAAIDSLVESVSLVQRSPEAYISTLVDNRAKREAEPWCNRNIGMGCWKAKRDADPWCNRNIGMGCWKAKRDAAPGPWCNRNIGMGCWKNKREADANAEPWCNRNIGMGCWKYKRDEADTPTALAEQKACLAEDGLCQHARRAAEAVLGQLNTVEARDSELAIAARGILDSLQANY